MVFNNLHNKTDADYSLISSIKFIAFYQRYLHYKFCLSKNIPDEWDNDVDDSLGKSAPQAHWQIHLDPEVHS
jgi:hypothetical protein